MPLALTQLSGFGAAPSGGVGPVVDYLNPADDTEELGVSVPMEFNVLFTTTVELGTGNITIKNLTDATQDAFATTDPEVALWYGTTVALTYSGIDYAKSYAVQVDAGFVKSLDGTPFSGILDDTTWNFTTVPPFIITPRTLTISWTQPGYPGGGVVGDSFSHFTSASSRALLTEIIVEDGVEEMTFLGVYPNVENLVAANGTLQNVPGIANLTGLVTLSFAGNALTQDGVNAILVALDANGVLEGICDISGGTNAVPNGAGATAKASLEGKDWFIITN